MSFKVTYNEAGFTHAVYEGELTISEALKMLDEVAIVLSLYNCRRLISDYTNARLALSFMDIHKMPVLLKQQTEEKGFSIFIVKRAIIAPSQLNQDFHFFETVSVNNSHNVKIFFNLEEARNWLLNEPRKI